MVLVACLLVVVLANRTRLAKVLGLGRSKRPASQPAARFPLQLIVKKTTCTRYDLVPIVIEALDPEGSKVPLPEPPVVRVLRDGEPQPTIAHREQLVPRYDRQAEQYRVWWPVPWNARPGVYTVEVRCNLASPAKWQWDKQLQGRGRGKKSRAYVAEAVCRASVRIRARKPKRLPRGLCAVTWEAHPPAGRIRKPDGTWGDWRALVSWAKFMGADALWCRGAITEVSRNWSLSMDQPFAPVDEEWMHRVAREAHRHGLKFGTWAIAMATYPARSNAGKPPYRYAQRITSGGAIVDDEFISLLDPDRKRHLAEFLRRMAQDPNIDMVGLDYLRPNSDSGYEVSDIFARRMPVPIPDGFFDWPRARRWGYVARKVEREWRTDPDFYEQWNWFRSHLVARYLRDIVELAGIDKPVWVFMFGWTHGQQIGQDPLMLTDGGADGLAVMLYQVQSLEHFRVMTDQWREYMEAGYCNLLPGDQVDFFWHQNMTRPRAAPEELYRRIVTAHTSFQRGSVCLGTFYHDISRTLGGRLGPYPGREWALAGAAAFSTVRRSWKVYPMVVELSAPEAVAVGVPFDVQLRMKSLTDVPIGDLTVTREDTQQVESLQGNSAEIAELPPRAELTIPWRLRVTAANSRRGNRFMVAFRVRWPEGDYGEQFRLDAPRTIVVMKYVDAR